MGHLVISSGQTYGATDAGASQNLKKGHQPNEDRNNDDDEVNEDRNDGNDNY